MDPTLLEAEAKARKIVNNWMAGATVVSWVPGSSFVLGTADVALIRSVAHAFGVKEYKEEAVVAAVTASVSGLGLSELLSFIPGPGWIAKAFIAGGLTKALGEAVIAYFRDRSPYKG